MGYTKSVTLILVVLVAVFVHVEAKKAHKKIWLD